MAAVKANQSNSFAVDLGRWLSIVEVYEKVSFAYDATILTDALMRTGKPFAALGLKIAAGVLLKCDDGSAFSSFRLGYLAWTNIYDVDASVDRLENALDQILIA